MKRSKKSPRYTISRVYGIFRDLADLQLLLNSLTEVRVIHHRVLRYLRGELFVKVGGVNSGSLVLSAESCNTQLKSSQLTTAGLNGGCNFLAQSFLKSICFEKNGWFLISCAPFTPSRFDGSRLRSWVRSDRASEPISSGKRRGSERILRYISLVFSS